RIGSSSSRLLLRAAKSAKRGSSASSSRPSAWHRSSQNFCLAQATVIQPSAVSKAWNGTIEGCADSGIRRGSYPALAVHVPTYISSCSAVSYSEMSQSQPTPSRRARHSPLSNAIAETYPPDRSTIDSPLLVGGPSGSPVRL